MCISLWQLCFIMIRPPDLCVPAECGRAAGRWDSTQPPSRPPTLRPEAPPPLQHPCRGHLQAQAGKCVFMLQVWWSHWSSHPLLTSLSLQSTQCVLQRPPRLLQETTLGDEDRLGTRQQPLLALTAQSTNHRGEGGGQWAESGQQLGVEQRHVCRGRVKDTSIFIYNLSLVPLSLWFSTDQCDCPGSPGWVWSWPECPGSVWSQCSPCTGSTGPGPGSHWRPHTACSYSTATQHCLKRHKDKDTHQAPSAAQTPMQLNTRYW